MGGREGIERKRDIHQLVASHRHPTRAAIEPEAQVHALDLALDP